MSVKSSFLIFTMLAFLVSIGFELINWSDEREEVNVMAEQHGQEMMQGFNKLMALKSDPFKKQAMDYAAWNDLANFTEQKDPTWTKGNLEGSTVQFGIDGFYVLDNAQNVLFSEVGKPFLENISTLIPLQLLDNTNGELLHFFAT